MNRYRDRFVSEVSKLPDVRTVSFGPSLNGSTSGGPLRLREWPEDQTVQTAYFGVDFNFSKVLDIEMIQGRMLSEDFARDSVASIIINERLASMIGEENPIGKRVDFTSGEFEIVGVFKDFHFKSLHHEIGPLALKIWLGPPRNVLIQYNTDNIGRTLQSISSTWQEVFEGNTFPFDYRFLDEQLQSMYQKEQEFAQLLKVFTGLAIFLALLGLFGVSSINIQQRIRQIGIRRVLGAELPQIAKVLSARYLIIA